MFNGSSDITIYSGNFNNITPSTGPQNEIDLLLQHCALGALLNSNERMDPARCHPNTREAVLEQIMAWIEDSNPDASMMIMHGPAGSGKSALAQSIAERCKLRQWLAAAFFFSRTAPGRNNGHTLIPTIAYQLMTSHPEVRRSMQMRLRRDQTLLKKSIPIVMEDLLIAPFITWIYIVLSWITGNLLFSLAFGWVHPRLIVIDGLDECSDTEVQSHILRAAATFTKSLRRPFRILIASRPEMHILRTLKESAIDFVPFDLGEHNASHDIQLFLNDKFEKLKQTHPLAEHGSFPTFWPGSDIITKIADNASGQFIYASVVMAYVECSKHSPVDRLNFILKLSPTPDSHAPFSRLDALYTHIFSAVEEIHLVRQILFFMAIPRTTGDGLGEYTTPTMIAKLLSPASMDSILLILEQLRSLISLAGPDEPIKFWHASISDFLLDESRSNDFFVDIQMAHEILARGYLRLFQSQGPDFFLASHFFSPFLEHYKRAFLSQKLLEDLVAYDFFSAHKAAAGFTLQGLHNAWQSERVQKLFRTLVLCRHGQSIINIYVDGLYRNYPLEPCIKASLRSFLDSEKSENFEAIQHALHVPILHCLLNNDPHAIPTSLAEKCVTGILWTRPTAFNNLGWSIDSPPNFKMRLRLEFALASNDCLSILLPYASHYSKTLVILLLKQQMEAWSLPEISLEGALVGPYLEQFENHVDAPPELKEFLEKYRASKCASDETGDEPTDSTAHVSSSEIDLQVSI